MKKEFLNPTIEITNFDTNFVLTESPDLGDNNKDIDDVFGTGGDL